MGKGRGKIEKRGWQKGSMQLANFLSSLVIMKWPDITFCFGANRVGLVVVLKTLSGSLDLPMEHTIRKLLNNDYLLFKEDC